MFRLQAPILLVFMVVSSISGKSSGFMVVLPMLYAVKLGPLRPARDELTRTSASRRRSPCGPYSRIAMKRAWATRPASAGPRVTVRTESGPRGQAAGLAVTVDDKPPWAAKAIGDAFGAEGVPALRAIAELVPGRLETRDAHRFGRAADAIRARAKGRSRLPTISNWLQVRRSSRRSESLFREAGSLPPPAYFARAPAMMWQRSAVTPLVPRDSTRSARS